MVNVEPGTVFQRCVFFIGINDLLDCYWVHCRGSTVVSLSIHGTGRNISDICQMGTALCFLPMTLRVSAANVAG